MRKPPEIESTGKVKIVDEPAPKAARRAQPGEKHPALKRWWRRLSPFLAGIIAVALTVFAVIFAVKFAVSLFFLIRVLQAPAVHETGPQQRRKLFALLVCETGIQVVGGRVFKVDFLMRHVKVAAVNDRFGKGR